MAEKPSYYKLLVNKDYWGHKMVFKPCFVKALRLKTYNKFVHFEFFFFLNSWNYPKKCSPRSLKEEIIKQTPINKKPTIQTHNVLMNCLYFEYFQIYYNYRLITLLDVEQTNMEDVKLGLDFEKKKQDNNLQPNATQKITFTVTIKWFQWIQT